MNDNKNRCFCDNSKGDQAIRYCYIQGARGPKGDTGPTGPKGEDGATTIDVGVTETGDPGTESLVENVGTNKNVILNFKIPKGKDGVDGEKGEFGPIGPVGPQGIQGLQGEVGPTGATGPKGDPGPTTIEVGTTEVGDPGTAPLVTNTGTNQNVILNFKIPRGKDGVDGEKGDEGPTGPQGPRGFPGEIGISQAITVDGTETVESDEEAQVQDDFENNVHHLTFYIPKGAAGAQGAQGPKGDPYGIEAYGERYSISNQRFKVVADSDTIIPLEQTGPAIFTNYNSTYSIGIRKYGTYLVNYFLNLATSVDTNYVINVKANGVKFPAGNIKVEGKANVKNMISCSLLAALTEDDEVTLVITSEQETDLIFDGTTTASLSVIKLD